MSSPATLIITGMHRSATSLTANWLRGCGLHLGDTLIGATPSNIKGHFEDKWVVEFHERLLKKCNATMYADESQTLTFSQADIEIAREWVASVSDRHRQWGFKQPRAALFLDLWNQVSPDAQYLFMIRQPESVVGSLDYRESQKKRRIAEETRDTSPLLEFTRNRSTINNQYLSMWLRHNRDCLEFSRKIAKTRFRFVGADELLSDAGQDDLVLNWLLDTGFHLDKNAVREFSDPNMISDKPHHISDQAKLRQAAILYEELRSLASSTSAQ